ncbi:hypothetical protein AMAG_12102 [Allomyces macrogynus ATCC 38327]|uniref:Zn(2)-C6 fungal-type domain-containing protein n=1 Tax=Allomyces macrogynus (strain ATCC 38327) TaxID=578462 RepID=A0A0L0SXG7_ALLM3|nr:hypothetical protein AMAG_12102 [Allomyces macrogynus ATCC 38327]|eukprot:KNE67024.1 hypothetical protein AMAG_12102 [Allomyces macrogynus ATCC 38327]
MFAGDDDPLALFLAELDDQAATGRTRHDHDQLGHDACNAVATDASALVDLDAWLATDPLATFPPANVQLRPDYLATPPLELSSPSTASPARRLDAADLAGLDLVCPDLALLLLDAQPAAATASLALPTTSGTGSGMGTSNATEPKLDESAAAAAASMTMNNARADDQARLDARADTVSWHSNCTDAGHVEDATPVLTIAAATQRTNAPQFHKSAAVVTAQPGVQVAPGPIATGNTNSVPVAPPASTVPVASPPPTATAPTAPVPPVAPSTIPAPAPRITISALMSLRHLAANSGSSYAHHRAGGGRISGCTPPSAPFPLITTPPALPPTPTPSPPAQTVPAGPRVLGGKVLRPVLPRPTAPPPPTPPRFPTPYAVYWPGATVPGAAPVRPTYVTTPVQHTAVGAHPAMPVAVQHPTSPMTVPHTATVQHPTLVQHPSLAQHSPTATLHTPRAAPTIISAPTKKPISCVHCRASHVACPGLRPCTRCVRLGRAETCVDYIPKRQLASSSMGTLAPGAKRRKRAGTASAACFPPPPPPESVALTAQREPPIPRAAAGAAAAARWGG